MPSGAHSGACMPDVGGFVPWSAAVTSFVTCSLPSSGAVITLQPAALAALARFVIFGLGGVAVELGPGVGVRAAGSGVLVSAALASERAAGAPSSLRAITASTAIAAIET